MNTQATVLPDVLSTIYSYDHHSREGWVELAHHFPVDSNLEVVNAKAVWADAFRFVRIEPCGQRIAYATLPTATLWQDSNTVEVILYTVRDKRLNCTLEGRVIVHCLDAPLIAPKNLDVEVESTDVRFIHVSLGRLFSDIADVKALEVGSFDPRFFKRVEFDTESDDGLYFHINPELCLGAGGAHTVVEVALEGEKDHVRSVVKNVLTFVWSDSHIVRI